MVYRFRLYFKILLWCSIIHFFLMLNIHYNGVAAMWQIVLEIPDWLIGGFAAIYALIVGIRLMIKSNRSSVDPEWSTANKMRLLLIPVLIVADIVATLQLAQ